MSTNEATRGRHLWHSARWVALARWGPLVVTWPVTIALARILSPADYGYLALVTVFTRCGRILAESGVSNLIVLGPELQRGQLRQLHGWSIAAFGSIAVILVLCGRSIERYYGTHGLVPLVASLAAGLMIEGFALAPLASLRRKMAFKVVSTADILRALGDSLTCLYLALIGAKYWSLVFGYLAGVTIQTLWILWNARLLPALPTLAGLTPLAGRAKHLVTASIAGFLAQNADAYLGGRILGAQALGGYTYMMALAFAPIEKIAGILTYIAPSVFGSLRGDRPALGRATLKLVSASAVIIVPAFVGLIVVADDVVAGVLGAKWLPYVSVLRVLCLQGIFVPMMVTIDTALIAADGEGTFAQNSMLNLLMLPPSFLLLSHFFGPLGLALAWLVPLPFLIYRRISALRVATGILGADWLRVVGASTTSALAMGAVVYVVRELLVHSSAIPAVTRLVICAIAGMAMYGALAIKVHAAEIRWLLGSMSHPLAARMVTLLPTA